MRCPMCNKPMELRYDKHSECWGHVCEKCRVIIVVATPPEKEVPA